MVSWRQNTLKSNGAMKKLIWSPTPDVDMATKRKHSDFPGRSRISVSKKKAAFQNVSTSLPSITGSEATAAHLWTVIRFPYARETSHWFSYGQRIWTSPLKTLYPGTEYGTHLWKISTLNDITISNNPFYDGFYLKKPSSITLPLSMITQMSASLLTDAETSSFQIRNKYRGKGRDSASETDTSSVA